MGVFVHILAFFISGDDFLDVLVQQCILILAGLIFAACINEQDIFAVLIRAPVFTRAVKDQNGDWY